MFAEYASISKILYRKESDKQREDALEQQILSSMKPEHLKSLKHRSLAYATAHNVELHFNWEKANNFSFNDYVESRAGKKWLMEMKKKEKEIEDAKKVDYSRMQITFDV